MTDHSDKPGADSRRSAGPSVDVQDSGVPSAPGDPHGPSATDPTAMYALHASDPHSELVDRSGFAPEDLAQIGRLFEAMGQLREVERRLREASEEYMKLNQTAMRAIHLLIVGENTQQPLSAARLANRLGISSAAVAKMLAKLEADGHVIRSPDPHDRRAQVLTVSASTRAVAMETVGRQQASRMHAALALSRQEREVVLRFLQRTTADLEAAMDASDHHRRS